MKVRSLVFSADDNVDSWLRFSSLCRHSGNVALAERVLTHQLGSTLPSDRRTPSFNESMFGGQDTASDSR